MIVQFNNQNRKYLQAKWEVLVRSVFTVVGEIEPFVKDLKKIAEVQLQVLFVGPRKIKEINLEQRGIDKPTDVLSFPMLEMKEGKLKESLQPWDFIVLNQTEKQLFIGDIILNMQQAEKQAVLYGHSFEREVAFLLTHGFYHLLGFDHQTKAEEKKMLKKQEQALNLLHLTREGEKRGDK